VSSLTIEINQKTQQTPTQRQKQSQTIPSPHPSVSMKILVGVKRVVDYAVKVRVAKGTVDLANVKQSMNPFCEVR
jgi:hypothetical protein